MVRNLLARTNTARTQSSTDPFIYNTSGLESVDVALQDIPRLSTETQRRNGFIQSAAEDRSTRIAEDMRNGNYPCSICTDTVASGNTRKYSVWHCRDCYNVFHLACIKMWAAVNGTSSLTKRWKCPFCSVIQEGEPEASCWCGKESLNIHNADNLNACQNTCRRATQCPHGYPAKVCIKPCHPGPCNSPCKANCPQPAARVAQGSGPAAPKLPSCWTRFRERLGKRRPGTVSGILWLLLGLTLVYALLAVFISYHIRWRTQPYRFPRFADKYDIDETMVCILVGMFFVAPVVFALITGLFTSLAALLNDTLNLSPTGRRPRPGHKRLIKSFGSILLLILAVGVLALPIIGVIGGPNIAWYHQMRNSCKGYDTRIRMDKYDENLKRFESPAQKFNISGLSHNQQNQIFYLASHLQPAYNTAAPFQHYYRLSGSANIPHLAVDVDLENRVWRVLRLNNSDEVNKFLAGQNEEGSRRVPLFQPVNEICVINGTFNKVSSSHKHMDIPELDLRIANMHGLIDTCEQEPFLRVYRTNNKTEDVKKSIGDNFWSSKYDKDIVMRTASFGHGRQTLDMCVKEEHVAQSSNGLVKNVMGDDLYVPMALITAHRLRMWEQHSRVFRC